MILQQSDLSLTTGCLSLRFLSDQGLNHREMREPGADLSDLPADDDGVEAAVELWTPEFISAWKAANGIDQPPTIEEARLAARGRLEAIYDAKVGAGAPWDFGGNPQTLQIREQDKANWLTFRGVCQELAAAGLGDDPAPLPMRATSNETFSVTANEGLTITAAIRTYAAGLLAAYWAHKDAITAAETVEAVQALDLGAGWP